MKQQIKHNFEAVSLLTTRNGLLDVTIVPAINQPDWLIPTALILTIENYDERIWTYLWQQQEVSVYHLIPRDIVPEKLIILEGNTMVHRFALQINGELQTRSIRISDLLDAELPPSFAKIEEDNSREDIRSGVNALYPYQVGKTANTANDDEQTQAPDGESTMATTYLPFVFQPVKFEHEDTVYVIPDLDSIAYRLVDLDG